MRKGAHPYAHFHTEDLSLSLHTAKWLLMLTGKETSVENVKIVTSVTSLYVRKAVSNVASATLFLLNMRDY